jgi:hypothetical protein
MGEVYAAHDPALNRVVALKVVRADHASPEAHDRFRHEALAASALNHPNILTIYELGDIDGARFIASEFVDGLTLRQVIRQRAGRLEWPEFFDLALQIAAALGAAHRAGIVHRDIKPENVMRRPDGLVKVLDFGLAKRTAIDEGGGDASTLMLTAPGVLLGTVLYMAPEQVRGLPVDARTDIWAFGCVLYEMASGQSPFAGSTSADILASVLEREPPPLTTLRSDCPPELVAAIARMLAKDPAQRPQSMADVEQSLRGARDTMPAAGTADLSAPTEAVAIADAPAPPSRRRVAVLAIAALALAGAGAAVALLGSGAGPPAPAAATTMAPEAPARRLDVWLTVQKVRDGRLFEEPFVSTGQEIFESGWKFRLHTMSADGGYLYVLNEGKDAAGQTTMHLLFPTPRLNAGSAQLAPAAAVESGWYVFTGQKGTETFWLVSSPEPVKALDAVSGVVNPVDKGLIGDAAQLSAIRDLLQRAASAPAMVGKDRERRHTTLTSRTPLLVHAMELQHH